jgi:hypothetical protein
MAVLAVRRTAAPRAAKERPSGARLPYARHVDEARDAADSIRLGLQRRASARPRTSRAASVP